MDKRADENGPWKNVTRQCEYMVKGYTFLGNRDSLMPIALAFMVALNRMDQDSLTRLLCDETGASDPLFDAIVSVASEARPGEDSNAPVYQVDLNVMLRADKSSRAKCTVLVRSLKDPNRSGSLVETAAPSEVVDGIRDVAGRYGGDVVERVSTLDKEVAWEVPRFLDGTSANLQRVSTPAGVFCGRGDYTFFAVGLGVVESRFQRRCYEAGHECYGQCVMDRTTVDKIRVWGTTSGSSFPATSKASQPVDGSDRAR